MAIARNYIKYPELLALQLKLDLFPDPVAHTVKAASAWVRKTWRDAVKAIRNVAVSLRYAYHNVMRYVTA